MKTGHSQISLGNAVWQQRSSKNDLCKRQWQQTLIHSHTFTDWYSHNVSTEAARCQELTYFFLQHIFSTFPDVSLVRTVKWWIDSGGIGGEQRQASISEWRRGVLTELPSLHLASPQPGLGNYRCLPIGFGSTNNGYQLPLSRCAPLWKRKQPYMHADTYRSPFAHSVSHSSSRSRSLSEHPASVCETDHWDAQRGREPATGLHCALIVPEPSKCQWCLQGMPAVRVCLYSVHLCGFMSLHVRVCVCV